MFIECCRQGHDGIKKHFAALRNKCFHFAIVRLAITNVFILPLCALRNKMLETCDPAGVRCGILGEFVPPGAKCFHCTIVRLSVINVFILPLCRLAVINVFILPLCRLAA